MSKKQQLFSASFARLYNSECDIMDNEPALRPAFNGYTRRFYSEYQSYRISKICATKLPEEYPIFFTFNRCKTIGGRIIKGSKSFVRSHSPTGKSYNLFHLSQCNFPEEIAQLFDGFLQELSNHLSEIYYVEEEYETEYETTNSQFAEFIKSADTIFTHKTFKSIPDQIKKTSWPYLYCDVSEFELELDLE